MSGVVVYMDWQNLYKRARSSFYTPDDPDFVHGQVWPHKLARLLVDDHNSQNGTSLQLQEIRIYRGKPGNKFDPTGYNAFQRQVTAWRSHNNLIRVIYRDLKYPTRLNADGEWTRSDEPVKEKGVDVALAVDVATMSTEGIYAHAIVFSSDNDLAPAIEYVHANADPENGRPTVSVAAWDGGSRLRPRARNVYCRWVMEEEFKNVEDLRDYTIPTSTQSGPKPGPR
ncbi:NYN domain-containing protein [Micrococcus luteus]|uniref:NYN domain-containing protein n=1 Tax=Micrococcus luteus TaxID=1270 RepID=UPI003018971E